MTAFCHRVNAQDWHWLTFPGFSGDVAYGMSRTKRRLYRVGFDGSLLEGPALSAVPGEGGVSYGVSDAGAHRLWVTLSDDTIRGYHLNTLAELEVYQLPTTPMEACGWRGYSLDLPNEVLYLQGRPGELVVWSIPQRRTLFTIDTGLSRIVTTYNLQARTAPIAYEAPGIAQARLADFAVCTDGLGHVAFVQLNMTTGLTRLGLFDAPELVNIVEQFGSTGDGGDILYSTAGPAGERRAVRLSVNSIDILRVPPFSITVLPYDRTLSPSGVFARQVGADYTTLGTVGLLTSDPQSAAVPWTAQLPDVTPQASGLLDNGLGRGIVVDHAGAVWIAAGVVQAPLPTPPPQVNGYSACAYTSTWNGTAYGAPVLVSCTCSPTFPVGANVWTVPGSPSPAQVRVQVSGSNMAVNGVHTLTWGLTAGIWAYYDSDGSKAITVSNCLTGSAGGHAVGPFTYFGVGIGAVPTTSFCPNGGVAYGYLGALTTPTVGGGLCENNRVNGGADPGLVFTILEWIPPATWVASGTFTNALGTGDFDCTTGGGSVVVPPLPNTLPNPADPRGKHVIFRQSVVAAGGGFCEGGGLNITYVRAGDGSWVNRYPATISAGATAVTWDDWSGGARWTAATGQWELLVACYDSPGSTWIPVAAWLELHDIIDGKQTHLLRMADYTHLVHASCTGCNPGAPRTYRWGPP